MNTPPAINRSSQVVLTIIGLIFAYGCLTVVLFPLFARHHGCGRPDPCYSHLRQLVVAAQLYAEDHNGNFPGANWVADINHRTFDHKILTCDKDTRKSSTQPISYGYSGLLLRADGSGVNVEQVMSPEEVGAFCDTSPTKTYPDGGIVAGGGLQSLAKVVTPETRHTDEYLVAAYVDGHVAGQRGPFNVKNLANDTTRSFYLANALRLIDNPVGGMSDFTPRILGTGPVAIGGDPCTAPLLRAAAAAWRQKARVEIVNCHFDGQYATKKRPVAYVWGIGDGMKPAGNAVAIGRDAVVVIARHGRRFAPSTMNGEESVMDYETIRKLFSSSHDHHVYSFDQHSGTRAFFARMLGINGRPMPISNKAIIVKDDWEMIQRVAQDGDGIGYCSATAIDMSEHQYLRVAVIDLQFSDGRIAHYPENYPQGDFKRRAIVPATPTWPLMRTFYAVSTLPKDNHFVDEMLAPGSPGVRALQAGPLFKASYYRP